MSPLRRRGILPVPAIWDQPGIDWTAFDALLFRSPWDYHYKKQAFLNWLDCLEVAQIRTWNPLPLMRWNIDKLYLRELRDKGVPIVPTVWLDSAQEFDLHQIVSENNWQDAIVKPTISATAHQTWRLSSMTAEQANAQARKILRTNGVMVQQFAEEIVSTGEYSFIFLGGEYSHTSLKKAKRGDFRVQDVFGGTNQAVQPEPHLLQQARLIADKIEIPTVYMRVDAVAVNGGLQLMELELIEPGLFLADDPTAADRLAAAIADKLQK